MPVNLGWCGFGNEWFAPREVKVRLTQSGGATKDLTFNQKQEVLNNDYDIKNGNNPYYQWGRKVPMLPGNGKENADKSCFTTDAQYAFQHQGLNTSEIKEYIQNPHKFNTKSEMDGAYINLWSTDNERTDANDEVVIKSVYDPSPVGYSLPTSNAFTGFTTTGQTEGSWPNPLTTEDKAKLNIKGDFDKGWYFYTKLNKSGKTFFFQASGVRQYDSGKLNWTNNSGCYWLSIPYITEQARPLFFNLNRIVPMGSNYRNFAMTVRSAEKKKGL